MLVLSTFRVALFSRREFIEKIDIATYLAADVPDVLLRSVNTEVIVI
jgi:hypothetical protein